jgi:hypothetical protein
MNTRRLVLRLVLLVLFASLLATAFAGWKWQKSQLAAGTHTPSATRLTTA